MIQQVSVAVGFLLLSAFSFGQNVTVKVTMENKVADQKNDTIYYDFNRPLTWNDFQGLPDNNSPAGAITSSGFAFNASMNMVGNAVALNLKVFTFFSKKNSWKKTNINSAYHLLHEQHHFDITRISAQKFYNDLLKAKFTLDNYSALLSTLFHRNFNESNMLQEQYDSETRHSLNTAAQLKWNDKIDQQTKNITQ